MHDSITVIHPSIPLQTAHTTTIQDQRVSRDAVQTTSWVCKASAIGISIRENSHYGVTGADAPTVG
jgi:hypothetical protein